jgi:hypothetical protein
MQITLLVFTATLSGIALDAVRHNSVLQPDQEPWVEWIAWALLAIFCRLRAVHSKRSTSTNDVEEGDLTDQAPGRPYPREIISLTLLAFMLVSSTWLRINRRESVVWLVVSIPRNGDI